MKQSIVLALSLFLTSFAQADGFVCENEEGTLRAAVYNQTNPAKGTRNAAILVLSNPSHATGSKTIATFSAKDGLLENTANNYTAKIDLRFTDSSRKGELIGGTKLGFLAAIELNIMHNVLYAIDEGQVTYGYLVLTKRNGDVLTHTLSCARYLKGE